jgi:hypothetical protein
MSNATTRRWRTTLATAGLIAAITASASGSFAAETIEQKPSDLKPCGTYDASALDPRPIPASIGGPGLLASIAKNGFKTPATMLGAPEPLPAVWYNAVKVTPEQAKAICEKHLTAVYLDWSGVPYNLAMRSGAKAVFSALGIKIVRFADYSFNPNGMAGVLTAILPLRPNILVTGGTVNAAQFAAIIKPAIDQGVTVTAWSLGSPTMKIGQNEPLKAMTTYDFYNLGLQMADAIHATWPNGANFGYIHWINDVDAIHASENQDHHQRQAEPRQPGLGLLRPEQLDRLHSGVPDRSPAGERPLRPVGRPSGDRRSGGDQGPPPGGQGQDRHNGSGRSRRVPDAAQRHYRDGHGPGRLRRRPADGADRGARHDRPEHPSLRDGPDLPRHDQDEHAGRVGLHARAGGCLS